MWIKKKVTLTLEDFAKQFNKSKLVTEKIPVDAVNLKAQSANDKVVIEWQEKLDEQSAKTSSRSGDGDNKLADASGDDAKK